jgi:hypothetical protein
MDAKKQLRDTASERVKGFDRARKALGYHIYRLHKRAKRYAESQEDEERYFRTLKTLGYLMQVMTGAMRSAFEEELSIVEEMNREQERILADYQRLKRLEDEYVRLTSSLSPEPEPAR